MGVIEIMAALKIGGAIIAAVILVALMTYWAAGRARPLLTAEIRADLVKQGLAHQFIDLPGGTVHYRLEGPANGPVIVLIHGFSIPSYVWDDYFAPLTDAGFRVLAFDNYGRGFSDRPKGPYNADLTDNLLVNLLNQLGIKQPVHLVGYSMGGAIATIFAARHPAEVASLTLIAPAGLGVGTNRNISLIRRPLIGDWIIRIFGLKIFHATATQEAKTAPNPARFLSDFDRQMDYRGYGDALLSTMRHYPLGTSQQAYAEAGTNQRPVMVIWGEADMTVPFANAQTLMSLMPNAKLYSYPNVGHSIAYSHAPMVIDLIKQFVESQTETRPGATPPSMKLKTRLIAPAK